MPGYTFRHMSEWRSSTLPLLLLLSCSLSCSLAVRVENPQSKHQTLEDGRTQAMSNARVALEDSDYRVRRHAPNEAHSRQKRATVEFDEDDVEEILESHNEYRQIPSAADMNYLTWNADLAEQAQAWADDCVMEHGNHARTAVSNVYSTVGQNLFMVTGFLPDNGYFVRAWYNEVSYYTYSTKSCQSGQACGHYTQVIWASTKQVGCGKKRCTTLQDHISSTSYSNAMYVVCNYGPAGNVVGNFPYVDGTACTECGSGSFQCWEDKLCRDCVAEGISECTCTADCGCGTRNDAACTCACQTGWTGGRCCKPCDNYHANCNNGWYSSNCNAQVYIPSYCPKMCGVCTEAGAGACTLPSNRQCVTASSSSGTTASSGGGGGGGGGGAATTTTTASSAPTTAAAASADSPTTAAAAGSATTAAGSATTTTAAGTTTTVSSAAPTTTTVATTTTVSTSTTEAVSTTTAAQEVRDAQANSGVLFKLQGSLSQWSSIWTSLQGILVDAINSACNTQQYYSQCCPGSGPQGSAQADYVSRDTVLVAHGYPIQSTEADSIEAIIYAQPLTNNQLCQPATRRRRHVTDQARDLLTRIRRATFTMPTFLPQEVLFTAVSDSSQNISSTLTACCNVTVASVGKSSAPVTEAPPTSGLPGWAIALAVIAGVVLAGIVVAVVVYVTVSKKPKKTVPVDTAYVTKRQTHQSSSKQSTPRYSSTTTGMDTYNSSQPNVPSVQ